MTDTLTPMQPFKQPPMPVPACTTYYMLALFLPPHHTPPWGSASAFLLPSLPPPPHLGVALPVKGVEVGILKGLQQQQQQHKSGAYTLGTLPCTPTLQSMQQHASVWAASPRLLHHPPLPPPPTLLISTMRSARKLNSTTASPSWMGPTGAPAPSTMTKGGSHWSCTGLSRGPWGGGVGGIRKEGRVVRLVM